MLFVVFGSSSPRPVRLVLLCIIRFAEEWRVWSFLVSESLVRHLLLAAFKWIPDWIYTLDIFKSTVNCVRASFELGVWCRLAGQVDSQVKHCTGAGQISLF